MGRDHKLSLIIGFVVLLVVGMLISDHVSRDQRGATRVAATIDQGVPPGVPVAGLDANPAPAIQLDESSAPVPVPPEQDALASGDNQRTRTAIEFIQDAGSELGKLFDSGPPQQPEQALSRVGGESRPRVETVSGTPRTELTPTPPQGVGAQVYHTVVKGDSLYAIARRYYGNGNLWNDLAKANPNRVSNTGDVALGVKLVLPSTLAGKPRQGSGAAQVPEPARSVPKAEQPSTPTKQAPRQPAGGTRIASREYTVLANDTLGHIAQRTLGTVRRQGELLALNSDLIRDPDDIRAGMVLKLPVNE